MISTWGGVGALYSISLVELSLPKLFFAFITTLFIPCRSVTSAEKIFVEGLNKNCVEAFPLKKNSIPDFWLTFNTNEVIFWYWFWVSVIGLNGWVISTTGGEPAIRLL